VAAYIEALGAVDSPYWAGRVTLVRRPEDIPVYDEVFGSFWLGRAPSEAAPQPVDAVDVEAATDDDRADDAMPAPSVVAVRYSPREALRHKDFAAYSPGEFAEARKLMADVRLAGALRRSRRVRPSRRTSAINLRASANSPGE